MSLSGKQREAYNNSNARINLLEGSVRSGKSFIALLIFMKMVKEGPSGEYIICGHTERTIMQNIIDPLQRLTGGGIKYNKGLSHFVMFDRKVYCIGASDERAESRIRGSTFAGAMVDEATIMPEGFFRMLLSRLSVPNSKLIATTNPDSPFHWLKTEFIDRAEELDMKVFKFDLDDNPSLTETYKNSLKKEYKGVWYERFIKGNWVVAEGAVYDFFDRSIHVVPFPPSYAKYYILGIDYGTTNPFAATLIGYNGDHKPFLWVEKEYYWDSRKKERQKTDFEYAADIINEFMPYNPTIVYLDPAATSFHVELQRQRIPVVKANNDVLDGIRFVSAQMAEGNMVVCANCTNLINEIYGYAWDANSYHDGLDRPKKMADHACVIGETLIETNHGKKTIKELSESKIEDLKVFSYNGNEFDYFDCVDVAKTKENQEIYCLELENGKKVKATKDHKIFTLRGYVQICDLLTSDEVLCYKE
jgi:PBSX family phage terminase large subunit